MSQSCASTAETAAILFRLSRKFRKTDKKFSERLLEEGLWGLKWLHKNRFDSLKILGWTVLDHYSDGKIGNFDDTPSQPKTVSGGIDNYYAIIANVEAALTFKDINPSLSEKSRQYAINDWKLVAEADHQWNTAELSMAIMAGSRLYDLTRYENIKNQCIGYADSLLAFQQTEPMKWTIPLNGFFYMNEERSTLFGYNHNVVVASPITGLVELCKLFPGHEKYSKWLRSVRLYANYLKTIARITAPYYMIPANIYKTGTPDDPQVRKGLKMDNDHYLRMFPVWQANRGNTSVILSSGISLAASNQLLKDPELAVIAQSQMEWIVGKNPFCQSLMYGEGYDFTPQYAVFTGDVVGGVPVGIQTRADNEVPYWPPAVLHN